MKVFKSTLLILAGVVVLSNAEPQNFFSDLANRFANTFRGNPRPVRQSHRPPQRFRPNQIHPQPQTTFHSQQPQHQSSNFVVQPQHQHHQTSHSHATQHSHSHATQHSHQHQQHGGVSSTAHHHQQPHHQTHSSNPVAFRSVASSSSSSSNNVQTTHGCAHAAANHFYDNKGYILTFLNGCSNFTGQEADEYCIANKGRAVSLDTTAKANHFHNIIAQHAQRYFWTGGRIDHNAGVVTWPSGNREGYTRGQRFWSYTGGSDPNIDIPQPDNRDGNEVCIGVLNNFYADGIKWHDVSCHHRKPTICQLN